MKIRACMMAAALLLMPATAHAGWWDWFDQLSGPGPFRSSAPYWTEFRIASLHRNPTAIASDEALASDDADTLRWFLTLRYVSLSNEAQSGQTRVRLTPADFAVMYRLASFVDVGAGVSILTFSGGGFETFSRVSLLAPKVTVTPLGFLHPDDPRKRAALRAIKVYADLTWAGRLSAADFQNAVPPFSDNTALPRAGVKIDFAALGYAIFHK